MIHSKKIPFRKFEGLNKKHARCQNQRHNEQHTYVSYYQPSPQTQRVTSAHKGNNINVNRPLQERNKQQHWILNSCYLSYKVPLFLLNFTVDQMPGDAEAYPTGSSFLWCLPGPVILTSFTLLCLKPEALFPVNSHAVTRLSNHSKDNKVILSSKTHSGFLSGVKPSQIMLRVLFLPVSIRVQGKKKNQSLVSYFLFFCMFGFKHTSNSLILYCER